MSRHSSRLNWDGSGSNALRPPGKARHGLAKHTGVCVNRAPWREGVAWDRIARFKKGAKQRALRPSGQPRKGLAKHTGECTNRAPWRESAAWDSVAHYKLGTRPKALRPFRVATQGVTPLHTILDRQWLQSILRQRLQGVAEVWIKPPKRGHKGCTVYRKTSMKGKCLALLPATKRCNDNAWAYRVSEKGPAILPSHPQQGSATAKEEASFRPCNRALNHGPTNEHANPHHPRHPDARRRGIAQASRQQTLLTLQREAARAYQPNKCCANTTPVKTTSHGRGTTAGDMK
ncbi:hypothetical protein V6N12_055239 [Hibiscus sabdariffa]|uniref:Uncharacterized protein n=1 Tax=Hibiscus sabdariffa TaxID=183260 RepID=A0ABR2BN24_9ROSI